MVREHGVSDARQVGRFGEVIAASSCPDENIIGKMADRVPSLSLFACQRPAQGCNVFVVPRVPIGDRRALRNACDLVAIIPPSHHTRVFRRISVNPQVPLVVVVDKEKPAVPLWHLVHHLRVRQALRSLVAMHHECLDTLRHAAEENNVADENDGQRDTAENRGVVVVQKGAHRLHALRAFIVVGHLPQLRLYGALHLHRAERPFLLLPLLERLFSRPRG
mmetsp:Transcript_57191/g.159167  ORF Transcript_57191/g.159167 Transcript_57191/m.159167 type:complete len:220 (-) Transcript_57191:1744-2403(-)